MSKKKKKKKNLATFRLVPPGFWFAPVSVLFILFWSGFGLVPFRSVSVWFGLVWFGLVLVWVWFGFGPVLVWFWSGFGLVFGFGLVLVRFLVRFCFGWVWLCSGLVLVCFWSGLVGLVLVRPAPVSVGPGGVWVRLGWFGLSFLFILEMDSGFKKKKRR